MNLHYLEIVTPDVDAVCATYASAFNATFGAAVPALGNARVADFAGGGLIGVRAPMSAAETPIVRPYLLVDDLADAVRKAVESGAEIAIDAMDIAGRGKIAIFMQGGVQHGVWQV
jgi:predicted enzyme related to lactoylglutathione lyase